MSGYDSNRPSTSYDNDLLSSTRSETGLYTGRSETPDTFRSTTRFPPPSARVDSSLNLTSPPPMTPTINNSNHGSGINVFHSISNSNGGSNNHGNTNNSNNNSNGINNLSINLSESHNVGIDEESGYTDENANTGETNSARIPSVAHTSRKEFDVRSWLGPQKGKRILEIRDRYKYIDID